MQLLLSEFAGYRERLVERARHFDERQFKKFEPLLENLQLHKRSATFGNALIIVRRITMLYMAMFIIGQ